MVSELSLASDHPSPNIIFSVRCLTVKRCCGVVGGGARPAGDGSAMGSQGVMGSVGRRYRDWKGMFCSGDLESRGGGPTCRRRAFELRYRTDGREERPKKSRTKK